MRKNLLEGFGQWLKTVDVEPKYAVDIPIILSNVVLQPADGGKPIKYNGLSMFKVVDYSPSGRWAKIKDVNYPNKNDRQISALGVVSPSPNAGNTYLVQGKQFDLFVTPQIPVDQTAGNMPVASPGGMPPTAGGGF